MTQVQGGHNICCVWQGEQPHCGFPEKNYHQNAERLARAGLKVVVVEQTETPAQLSIRNEERKANKQNQVILPAQQAPGKCLILFQRCLEGNLCICLPTKS